MSLLSALATDSLSDSLGGVGTRAGVLDLDDLVFLDDEGPARADDIV